MTKFLQNKEVVATSAVNSHKSQDSRSQSRTTRLSRISYEITNTTRFYRNTRDEQSEETKDEPRLLRVRFQSEKMAGLVARAASLAEENTNL